MITPAEYKQFKAFARMDGLMIGLLWTFTFGCFFYSTRFPGVQLGFIAGLIATPFLVYYRLRNYRDRIIGGFISFRRAFGYSLNVSAYGLVILAVATIIYFQFLDEGQFMGGIVDAISSTETQTMFKSAGIDTHAFEDQIHQIAEMRPIDMAFGLVCDGMLTSAILSLILGLIAKRQQVAPQN